MRVRRCGPYQFLSSRKVVHGSMGFGEAIHYTLLSRGQPPYMQGPLALC